MNSQSVLTTNPEKGRKILRIIIIVPVILVSLVFVIWGVIQGAKKQVVYTCTVDTMTLGQPLEDLCQLVPEGIRLRNNVLVTGGMATYPGVIKIKDDPTVYYNLLTPAEQINTLVKTPGPIRFFEKFGFYWGVLGGMVLIPVFIGLYRLVRKLMGERKRFLMRQERINQQRPSENQDKKTFDLKVSSV